MMFSNIKWCLCFEFSCTTLETMVNTWCGYKYRYRQTKILKNDYYILVSFAQIKTPRYYYYFLIFKWYMISTWLLHQKSPARIWVHTKDFTKVILLCVGKLEPVHASGQKLSLPIRYMFDEILCVSRFNLLLIIITNYLKNKSQLNR